MSKELLIVIAIAVLIVFLSVPAHAAQVWILVDSQYSGREWYCTYQLNGTTITTQFISSMPCAQTMLR